MEHFNSSKQKSNLHLANSTERDILRRHDENDWRTAEDIRLLSAMAALFHDFGKASVLFQNKLAKAARVADPYRHEWVSLRLFQAFVGNDDDQGWLKRLAEQSGQADTKWIKRLLCDGKDKNIATAPLAALPPLARAIGWLVVSHHRLPTPGQGTNGIDRRSLLKLFESIDHNWCGSRPPEKAAHLRDCWNAEPHLPDTSAAWRTRAGKLARRMLDRASLLERDWLAANPYVAHLARLALMLADHHYSSCPANPRLGDPDYGAYANTDREGQLKQKLDEHLIGVEKNAHHNVYSLPRLADSLPRIARHKGFKRRSQDLRFRWQDKAFDLALALRQRSEQQGFFGVNMASTGCGKTLANGRIMYALADPQRGARFSIALGLRTLTLQTGQAYRTRLGLGEDDLAVLVGGGAVRQLFNHRQAEQAKAEPLGSESAAALLPDNTSVHYDGNLEDGPLNEWLADNGGQRGNAVQKLLNAPVLVCTIDHLMPANESTRGGGQIAPMLRLMTSDLVLDEPDDFGIEDLPALTRLVHFAGMLGSRVLLSSATLPPALIQGLFGAYLAGRVIYQQNRGMPGLAANVCCAWFDEHQVSDGDHADENGFRQAHDAFVQKRLGKLAAAARDEVRRRARIVAVDIAPGKPEVVRPKMASLLLPHIHALHAQHHSVDPVTGKRVSFGLVRMANIDPLVDVARALFALGADAGHHIHLCIYHSRHPLLVRSAIERRLDRLLLRADPKHGAPDPIFKDSELRIALDQSEKADHIFVVLASPVAEVGRDHDYDWAIVEPSSMRSFIQLAGRVRRHRSGNCAAPNILLLDTNCHALEQPGAAAFQRPGFEKGDNPAFRLASHRLTDLLRAEEYDALDATPRIVQHAVLDARHSLVDLEHARLSALMLGTPGAGEKDVRRWWTTLSHYSGVEQFETRFCRDDEGRERFVLLPDEDGEEFDFFRIQDDGSLTSSSRRFELPGLKFGESITPWGGADYLEELLALAEGMGIDGATCARRFGFVDLPERGNEHGWRYHHVLGFRRRS